MPMPPYTVFCYRKGCGQKALYKIAAHWSDGVTSELKTYALSCADCLAEWYKIACAKQAVCRKAPGEKLERPCIFEMQRGTRDRELVRRPDLEEQLGGSGVYGASPGQST